MLTLGFMTLNHKTEAGYFTEIARRAKEHEIICYRFIPSKFSPLTEQIEGERFDPDKDAWVEEQFLIPSILYDRCFYGHDLHSRQCKGIVNWFKTKDKIQFLGFGLPNKLMLYEALTKSKLAPYIPRTIQARSSEQVYQLLQDKRRIILKPTDGSGGSGIYSIELYNKEFIVKTDKMIHQVSRTFKSKSTLLSWLDRILSKADYMLQPFLSLQNERNQPFDIRALLQKDQFGHWSMIGKGIRQGKEGGIVSNLNYGGIAINFEEWLANLDERKRRFIIEEIDDILTSLPTILETQFPPLFELGVDIGIAKDLSIWILDVNSKPGRKVLLETKPELKDFLYESPLLYAKFLQERRPEPYERERVISD